MEYDSIKKENVNEMPVKPNLFDYEEARNSFNWDTIRKELDWLGDGKINIAYECIDRHLKTTLKDKVALYWEGKDGETEEYSFHDLSKLTNRFASALKASMTAEALLLTTRAASAPVSCLSNSSACIRREPRFPLTRSNSRLE